MKKILVTGGAGFVGSALCEELLKGENEVYCVDNFVTGSFENVKNLTDNEKFHIVTKDVCDMGTFRENIDQIYNLACPASPVKYQTAPILTTKTSVLGAISCLELARRTGATILQASTSEVYGDAKEQPQTERYFGNVNPIGIRSCYDEGKRCAESLFFDYYRYHGVKIKVVRIFNTYGPKMAENDGRVVSNFIIQALRNEQITIHGSGNQTRSLMYISDLVSGLIAMMNTPEGVTGPVNIGNPYEISVEELANRIISLTGSKSVKVFVERPKDDPQNRKPDITVAKSLLNWAPQVSLDDGLIKTINYFKNII